MRELFTIDLKDYDLELKRFKRPSARTIIINGGKIAMVYSQKYDYYKYPGGGIEDEENHEIALIREVQRETGLRVIPDSIFHALSSAIHHIGLNMKMRKQS